MGAIGFELAIFILIHIQTERRDLRIGLISIFVLYSFFLQFSPKRNQPFPTLIHHFPSQLVPARYQTSLLPFDHSFFVMLVVEKPAQSAIDFFYLRLTVLNAVLLLRFAFFLSFFGLFVSSDWMFTIPLWFVLISFFFWLIGECQVAVFLICKTHPSFMFFFHLRDLFIVIFSMESLFNHPRILWSRCPNHE